MTMPELTVVAKVVAKKEFMGSVKSELLKLIVPTRKEDGCIDYRLHQDNEDPAVFIFYETWKSLACLERHIESDHFKSYVNAVDGMIEDKEVHKMTLVG